MDVIDEAEEFQLYELGTIEEVSRKAQERKRAASKRKADRSKSRKPEKNDPFYDKNSIGRKQNRQRSEYKKSWYQDREYQNYYEKRGRGGYYDKNYYKSSKYDDGYYYYDRENYYQ